VDVQVDQFSQRQKMAAFYEKQNAQRGGILLFKMPITADT
jgi:hypothetical protein